MDRWMNGWMDKWVDGQISEWENGYIWYISMTEYRAVTKEKKTQATQNNVDKPLKLNTLSERNNTVFTMIPFL